MQSLQLGLSSRARWVLLYASRHEVAIPTPPNRPAEPAYRAAGVDIDKAAALVETIKPLARATDRPGVLGGIGGFGALFDPKAAGYDDPILVASTDGVGTKLKLAIELGRHDTIGIDLVAMCVNDVVVQGAEPLFFLDYFATGRLDPATAAAVLQGIAEGCRRAGCALVGGETAEMPGLYAGRDYDLAGFAVGAVERGRQLTGAEIKEGDVILGLASDGVHANGFSLIRRLLAEGGYLLGEPAPYQPGVPLGISLLTPTRLYVRSALAAARAGAVKALAHITGGGLIDNVPRVLPTGLGVAIDAATWRLPPVFGWLKQIGGLSALDLARTLNCGIGMIAVAAPERAEEAATLFRAEGETVHRIGTVVAGNGVQLRNADTAWHGVASRS